MPEAKQIAVIGGGYAGLAAAVELAARGVAVTVFEAAAVLGGRARRVEHLGIALDNGLHILIGAYHETLRLIRLVNPEHASALLRLPFEWRMHHEFHFVTGKLPAPLHLLGGLLTAHGMELGERLAAIRFLRTLRKIEFKLALDISVEDLLEQHRQSERSRRVLWRPLCIAALNTPPTFASAQVFLNVLRDSLNRARSDSDLILARVDLSRLFPEPAAEWITQRGGTVRTAHRVTAIDPVDNGFVVEAAGLRRNFSHVICALPPHQVNAFLIGITALSDTAAIIEGLQYEPIHSVWLQYPTPVELPSVMLGFSGSLVHWAFDREKLCGQRGLIGAVISASGGHQHFPHDELGWRVHRALKQQLGNLPEPLWQRVIDEKRAGFSCAPGLIRPPQATPLRNFYLAGDYTEGDYPATLEAAVRSGIRCAELALA